VSDLVPVATTLGGLVIGGWAGWLAGFMTAEWSMDGIPQMVGCITGGAVVGAAAGAYVGAKLT
jgi:uncharacterized membrane protein YeaQ/YmgE (transglycosylase-associated protein family)